MIPAAPSVDIERYLVQAKSALTGRRYEAAMEYYRAA